MPLELIDHLGKLGFIGGLVLFVFLLYTKRLRWGWEFEDLQRKLADMEAEKQRAEAKEKRAKRVAAKGIKVVRHALALADKTPNGDRPSGTETDVERQDR